MGVKFYVGGQQVSVYDAILMNPMSLKRYTQLERVHVVLKRGQWETLASISAATGDPEASVSARICDLRKPEFGAYDVQRAKMANGLYRYRLASKMQ